MAVRRAMLSMNCSFKASDSKDITTSPLRSLLAARTVGSLIAEFAF